MRKIFADQSGIKVSQERDGPYLVIKDKIAKQAEQEIRIWLEKIKIIE